MKLSHLLVTVLLIVATLSATFAVAEVADDESTTPLLFVSKRTSSDDVVLGSSVEVIVTVWNYGQSPAFDVVITDTLPDASEKTKTIDSLPYGASESLRYTVTPTVLGNYLVGVAHVAYNLEQGNAATERHAVSNIIREGEAFFRGEGVDDESFRGVVSVLTRERYDRLHAHYLKETTAYLFLGVIPALFPYVLYRVKQSQSEALIRDAKRNK